MGIWWAAGFSTAAIRIIDDDARGTWNKVVGCEWWFANLPCLPSCKRSRGLPMDGGDVQVNKFIRILRSERQIEMASDRWDVVPSAEVFFSPTAWAFCCFLQKGFWMSGCCEESWKCNVDENWRLDSRWHFFKLWFNSPAVKAARWTSLGTYSQLHRALHKVTIACDRSSVGRRLQNILF